MLLFIPFKSAVYKESSIFSVDAVAGLPKNTLVATDNLVLNALCDILEIDEVD